MNHPIFAAPITPDTDQAITFFRALFPMNSGECLHFRGVPEPKDERASRNCHYALDDRFEQNVKGFLEWCNIDGRAGYVLPGSVRAGGTGKNDVVSLPAICVDFDKGDPSESLRSIERIIGNATVVVESGGATAQGPKLHAYWHLAEPATGAAIDEACRVREELARRFGGDPVFKQAAQVIRIPGSIHFKNGPKLVRLRKVDPSRSVTLPEISAKLGTNIPAQEHSNVVKFYDFFNAPRDDESDTDRVMVQPIHEGATDDMTRFEGGGKAIGHFIHLVREGTLKNLDEAWERVKAWNVATLVPPWSEDRLRNDFERLVHADLKTKGPFVPPAPVMATQAAGLVVLDCPADRFTGPPPARQWLAEGLIPLGTPGVFAAVGDAGKSMLALRLALYTSCYSPAPGPHDVSDPLFFGCPVRARGAVVMLTGEDDNAEVHRRLNALDPENIRAGKPLYIVSMISEGGPRAILADGPQGPQPTPFWTDLRAQLEAIPDLRLVVLDPLSTFTGADLNDNTVGAAIMTMLAELASKTGAAIMVVHHLNKGSNPTSLSDARNAIRGAGALVDNSRWSLVMWEADENDAFDALDALGRKDECIRSGIVYKGGVAKSNAPAAKTLRTLVRGPAGLLEDLTDTIRSNTVGFAEIDAAVHQALLVHWQQEKKGEWSFTLGRTKVGDHVVPALKKQGIDLSHQAATDCLRRLLNAGKLRETRDGKFEPVPLD